MWQSDTTQHKGNTNDNKTKYFQVAAEEDIKTKKFARQKYLPGKENINVKCNFGQPYRSVSRVPYSSSV